MNDIVRPITEDGLVGFDKFGQLACHEKDGKYTRMFFVSDVRGKICPVCNRGWDLTGPGFADQYRWSSRENQLVHHTCMIRYWALIEHDDVYMALVQAKIRFSGLREIKNQYWGNDPLYSKKPWYETDCLDGPYTFVIGHRKRVWEANLKIVAAEFTLDQMTAIQEKFKDRDVTKGFGSKEWMFHAWTMVEMCRGLKDIQEVLGLVRKDD